MAQQKLKGKVARIPVDRDSGIRRGFFFIVPDGAPPNTDIFAHASGMCMASKTFEELREGDRVEYTEIDGPKGPRAIEIMVLQ